MRHEIRQGQVWQQSDHGRVVWLVILLHQIGHTPYRGKAWSAYAMVTPSPGQTMYMPYFAAEDVLSQASWRSGVQWTLVSDSTSGSDGPEETE